MVKLSLRMIAPLVAVWFFSISPPCRGDDRTATRPVKIIFDTDMDSDCDDVGALAVLHALADRGEAQILATTVSSNNEWSPLCVSAINHYYGRGKLPIGVPKGEAPAKASKYAKGIAERFAHELASAKQAEDAVKVIRGVLESQADHEVVIVTVGYLTNVANLLKEADGAELIRKKVKRWVCMGGNFVGKPARDDLKLGNNNFTFDKAAALYAVRNWPGEATFVGREIGSVPSGLKVGAALGRLPESNPIRMAYQLYFGGDAPKDRHVADPTTVLFAVRGLADYWEIEEGGFMDLQADMTFTWQEHGGRDGGRGQSYLLKKKGAAGKPNDRYVERVIEGLMLQEPGAVR
jgi:hypothetical protein